jgi:2-polyprenyl-3-methyl-5-hydroxy-6-metoxy-1,4-benzoquinol methylase
MQAGRGPRLSGMPGRTQDRSFKLSNNTVQDYGWNGTVPNSCGYLAPEIVRLLRELAPRKVIDIGCGNGSLCGLLKQMNYEVRGIEYDQAGCALARQNHPTIPFFNLGVQDDPSPVISEGGLCDVAVSTEVVEHLFSPHLLPQFAAQVLKPGGHLIVTTPYHGYLKNLILSLTNHWDTHHTSLWHGGHIKFWSRTTLAQLLQENGFAITGFSGVGRMPYLWKSMIVVARKI